MRPYLDSEQERRACERADVSESMFHIFIAALLLVGSFSFFMIITAPQ